MIVKKTYPIIGMHCASCAKLIEKKLSKIEGVSLATVNYGNETAYVESNNNLDNEVDKTIVKLGYKVGKDIEKEKNKELKILKTKVIISSIAAGIGILDMIFGLPMSMYYLPVISIFVQIFIGWEFYQSLWSDMRSFSFGMNSLVAIGTTAAVVGGYWESSVVIIALILLGRYLEINAKGKTGQAIKKLLELKGSLTQNLKINDLVKVLPGQKIATDGVITTGESYIDESMITGESSPVLKNIGSKVFGGTINTNGSFTFKVTKVGSETLLSQIIESVRTAQGSKAEIQNLADLVSNYFVPIVLVIATITFIFFGLANAIAVLVIACPCAMGLATPTAIIVGVGRGASVGILIKDAHVLEIFSKIKTIVFDKTGTITIGRPILINKVEKKYLAIAASLEANSEHPIAMAIVREGERQGAKVKRVGNFKALSGKGVEGIVDGKKYFLGKTKDNAIALVQNRKTLATFDVHDKIKDGVKNVIDVFSNKNIDTWMISGDKKEKAENVAKKVGITNVLSEQLPEDKLSQISILKTKALPLAFVGDGINDSPSLAKADVGIALGTGTDVAIEAAGITLLNKNFNSILIAYNLSRQTIKIIKQNLFWAFIYNIVLIPAAMFGVLNPMLAAFAMSASSITVIGNSLRLNYLKLGLD